MRSIEVEGPSVEAAVSLGISALGIQRDEAVITVLRDEDGGGQAKVRVAVAGASVDAGQVVSRETVASPTAVAPVVFPGKQLIRETLDLVLGHLGIRPLVTEAPQPSPGVFEFSVSGDGASSLIGRHGQTLEALEYLLTRIGSQVDPSCPKIALDVEGYRARREASLEELAKRSAERAKHSGEPVALPPMSPRDRRIVHLTLESDPAVSTHSEGAGSYRTLVVTPLPTRRS